MPVITQGGYNNGYEFGGGYLDDLRHILNSLDIKKLNILPKITTIGGGCFRDSVLEDITLPDGLAYINDFAFDNCGLKKIDIPDTVKSLSSDCFDNCRKLKRVKLPKNNHCIHIPVRCFRGCNSLESIDIPDNIKTISDSAFYNCFELKTVKLPKSLETIEDTAFNGLDNCIPNVYYDGTVQMFKRINKGPHIFPRNQTIHCVDGDYIYRG